MAEVTVRTGEVEVRSTRLTKSLLKQIEPVENPNISEYLPGGAKMTDPKAGVVGWVHGTVLEADENYWRWLVVRVAEGDYVRIRLTKDTVDRIVAKRNISVPQLYVV